MIPARVALTCVLRRPGLVLRLFSNDVDTNERHPSAYREVTASGYQSVTFDPSQWTITENDATYPEVSFEFTGATLETIFGYYVTDGDFPETVLMSGLLDTPADVGEAGGTISITTKLWA